MQGDLALSVPCNCDELIFAQTAVHGDVTHHSVRWTL